MIGPMIGPMLGLGLALLVGLGLGAPANAQIGTGNGPVDISANRSVYNQAQRSIVYTGDVDAIQDGTRLRAQKLTILFAARPGDQGSGASTGQVLGSGLGQAERMIAENEVFYITADERVRADRAVYELTSRTITMSGNVVVSRGKDVLTGGRLVINLETNTSMMDPVPGGRVRTAIFPSQTSPGGQE
jgi:lipopolysaccharide export system protein LptA